LQGARIFAKATGVILHPPHNDSSSDTSIGSQNLSPGSKIAEGQAMFNIGELSTLKVTAQLSEIDVNTINIGLPVKYIMKLLVRFLLMAVLRQLQTKR